VDGVGKLMHLMLHFALGEQAQTIQTERHAASPYNFIGLSLKGFDLAFPSV
jgi:hypothetical protein